jgi:5'-nucleotidase
VLHDKYIPRKVFTKGDIKIGVTGVGIELDGLVASNLYGPTKYLDPVKHATEQANILKHDEKCNLVICLSHLGYRYDKPKVSDIDLAKNSNSIDLILGGHTHTFMDKPDYYRNLSCEPVIIHQVGWAGMRLGKIDVTFERNKKNKCITCDGMWVKNV